ncbi:hypothetical protein D3C84_404110 [compost metagenome]
MPAIKFYAPYEAPFLPFNITAYMLFPKDENLRESYMAQKLAEYTLFCADEDQIDSVPIEILKGLLINRNQANPDIRENIVLSGSTAGHILLNLIKLDASGEEASVNKAIYLGAEYFADAENAAGGKIASSDERHIRRAWSSHKSVAHFWAALQVQIQTDTKLTGIDSTDLYLRLPSLAKELSKIAITLTNKNAKGPIFKPDELWTQSSSPHAGSNTKVWKGTIEKC